MSRERIKLSSKYMCISNNSNLSSYESSIKMLEIKEKKPLDETMCHKLLK
ncbi:hypothetical protein BACCAP_01451 [Pseudoflavonifractor capillosus ATCC 29799]|uniref:Uncharacterized protein n=1 Tax=Pseudoflavonifractor capillosus ATCC 29799 TaxID=411467 RepID=A6NTC2_9FIRM|nr:hypothetical protein BACCAP_01451 [Pseudoflavonifractor capillosus ATCC 29799]